MPLREPLTLTAGPAHCRAGSWGRKWRRKFLPFWVLGESERQQGGRSESQPPREGKGAAEACGGAIALPPPRGPGHRWV